MTMFTEWNAFRLSKQIAERSPVHRAAEWIVEHNAIVAICWLSTGGQAHGT